MTPEAQRIALAEACGWTCTGNAANGRPVWTLDHWTWVHVERLPDYLSDLNAMHEAEKTLTTREQQADYSRNLIEVLNRNLRNQPRFIGPSSFDQSHATAAQRAEAFLRTLNKWQNQPTTNTQNT